MNAFEKQRTFTELRNLSKQLESKVNADPLRGASTLLSAAIAQLDRCDDLVEENQAQERRRDKLAAEVAHLQERKESLIEEHAALANSIEASKQSAEHWERVEKDKLGRAMVAG